MLKTADAVVIGGGIMGASVAHFLAKKGFGRIALLEKRTLAAVSTGHSAAVVRTFYSNPLTVALATRALQMFENSDETLGGGLAPSRALVQQAFALAGDRVIAVETDDGVIETPVAVNAAGPWGPSDRADRGPELLHSLEPGERSRPAPTLGSPSFSHRLGLKPARLLPSPRGRRDPRRIDPA